MSQRQRLPSRHGSVTFDLSNENLTFTCTAARGDDGTVLEVFLQNHKAGSMAGITASDAAVCASLALQFGCPFETLRRALMRDPRGKASGPLGAALDQIAGMKP
jgi:ribonucleoside-diphosphate reductase alpha chain